MMKMVVNTDKLMSLKKVDKTRLEIILQMIEEYPQLKKHLIEKLNP